MKFAGAASALRVKQRCHEPLERRPLGEAQGRPATTLNLSPDVLEGVRLRTCRELDIKFELQH